MHAEDIMLAKDLISDSIVPLKTSDTGQYAMRIMEEYKVSHLPIVNNVDFLGLISEEDIYLLNDPNEVVGNHTLSLSRPFVDQYQHIYDVILLITTEKLTIIPVLNKSNHYLGIITIQDLADHFGQITAVQNPGGIIVLELNENDYAMTEIAQIIESNDAKILSSYVTGHKDSTKLELTLKINKMNIYPILQTFDRYKYTVVASFSESSFKTDLMDRYNSLMSYLNI
jgi:acetoin utilization protein AcuB